MRLLIFFTILTDVILICVYFSLYVSHGLSSTTIASRSIDFREPMLYWRKKINFFFEFSVKTIESRVEDDAEENLAVKRF